MQLDERLYKEAERRAAEAGFSSVDAYVADVISQGWIEDVPGETTNLGYLFTPARLAETESAIAQVEAGNFLTEEQMQQYFKQIRVEWDQKKML